MTERTREGSVRENLAAYQPLFGLRVITPSLELSMPTDDELLDLLAIIDGGIHDPDFMPFLRAWTDEPRPERNRNSLAYWWQLRATWSSTHWNWCAAVHYNGEIIGVQHLMGTDFATKGEVKSASWLGQRFQNRGHGKEMRAAVLHLAFEGLGATRAYSGYLEGNVSSQRVSTALGYEIYGTNVVEVRGKSVTQSEVVLERSTWESMRRSDITVIGLDECRSLFGSPTGP